MDPVQQPIQSDNHGIQQLQKLIRDLRVMLPGPLTQATPIVLVPGFSAWGEPLLGAVNYFGGFSDFASILAAEGNTVIEVRISPLSSNRERACEIFQQLANISVDAAGVGSGFDAPGAPPTLAGVNYGTLPRHALLAPHPAPETWKAVVHGALPPLWQWTPTNKVNFICHSQGGTTVRHLLYLLSGRAPPDLGLFPAGDERARVKAVITLGTPHKGTTVTEVVQSLLQGDPNLDRVVELVTSLSFAARRNRPYDLGLDHWGFRRNPGESLLAMRQRIAPAVIAWFRGTTNGLWDNSIAGAAALHNLTASLPPAPVYFFTMSFRATIPFPNRTLTRQDIAEFFGLLPGGGIANFLGVPTGLAGFLGAAKWAGNLTGVRVGPQLQAVIAWITNVANRHLGDLGYFSHIPPPGPQVPRPDMLPVIAVFGYGIGGRRLDHWAENDGIVNTPSMDGPDGNVRDIDDFLPLLDPATLDQVQGPFWHVGLNNTIDHADQLGVFTDDTTNAEVEVMYKLLAELADRIP